MKTISDFVRENKISMKCERTDSNPSMPDSRGMDHWKCTLTRGSQREMVGRSAAKRMSVVFSQGYGHGGAKPTVENVLDCLASDASGYENNDGDFEMWCREYAYDADDLKTAGKTFRSIEKQAKKLKAFLGSDLCDELMYRTERE